MSNSPVSVKGLGGPEFVSTNAALLDLSAEAAICPDPGQFHLAEEKINDRARHSKRYKEEGGRLKEWMVVTSWSANSHGTKAGILVTHTDRAGGQWYPTYQPALKAPTPAPGVWPGADSLAGSRAVNPRTPNFWVYLGLTLR